LVVVRALLRAWWGHNITTIATCLISHNSIYAFASLDYWQLIIPSSQFWQTEYAMKKKCVRIDWRQCNTSDTVEASICKQRGKPPGGKNKNNLDAKRISLSEIKLKRTDTTLDLSQ